MTEFVDGVIKAKFECESCGKEFIGLYDHAECPECSEPVRDQNDNITANVIKIITQVDDEYHKEIEG